MSYTPTTWTTGDTITASAMNKIENGIASAGGYDLIIEYNNNTSTVTILSGDILDCEDKLDNGETVNAVCIVRDDWSWTPSSANTNKSSKYLPLVEFIAPYCQMRFGGVYYASPLLGAYVNITYDADTGNVTGSSYATQSI